MLGSPTTLVNWPKKISKQYLDLNDNKNTIYWNVWDVSNDI